MNVAIPEVFNPYLLGEYLENKTVFLAPGHEPEFFNIGARVPGLKYKTSDALMHEFGPDSYNSAWKAASDQDVLYGSAAHLQAFLQSIFQDQGLELVHIIVNVIRRPDRSPYIYRTYGFAPSKAK